MSTKNKHEKIRYFYKWKNDRIEKIHVRFYSLFQRKTSALFLNNRKRIILFLEQNTLLFTD